MELLSVAQKYEMGSVLARVRHDIAGDYPPPTRLEPTIYVYSLAEKYGLRPEAFQAARTIAKYPMTIENLDNMSQVLPCSCLYQLWKYHERVRAVLALDLRNFRTARALDILRGFLCFGGLPNWLQEYIFTVGIAPDRFDVAEFSLAMARHYSDSSTGKLGCNCGSIPSQKLCDVWEALASVIHGSFEKVSVVGVLSCFWMFNLFPGGDSSVTRVGTRKP